MKKADKVLLAVITLSAAVFFAAGMLKGLFTGTAVKLCVYADNEKLAEYSLNEDGVYDIKTVYGHNILTVKDGEAYVTETDCPGRDCMRMKTGSDGGSIICLPHHLVIKPEAAGTEGTDAVAR